MLLTHHLVKDTKTIEIELLEWTFLPLCFYDQDLVRGLDHTNILL